MQYVTGICTALMLVGSAAAAVRWEHPSGFVTRVTIAEIRSKLEGNEWARRVFNNQKRLHEVWMEVDSARLRAGFPTRRANVYHNFSCPVHRLRLEFDPFDGAVFRCPVDGQMFAPDRVSNVYEPGNPYHGTLYDGWANLFYLQAAYAARDLSLIGMVEEDVAAMDRAIELLMLFSKTIKDLPKDLERYASRILTYNQEGDGIVLNHLVVAYELARNRMTPVQRGQFERNVLQRIVEDLIFDPPVFDTDLNNMYQWHRAVILCGLALEREDYIDWSFGYGKYADHPVHRHLRRMAKDQFLPDGASWELCSGYHLYSLAPFCELAFISRNLSVMDPERFPPEKYDFSNPASEVGRTIHNALEWFMSAAMPDRTMPSVGDSMNSMGSMEGYWMTSEVGYRYFNVLSVGDFKNLREGRRNFEALIVGDPVIRKHRLPYTSHYLAASGWVALRGEGANGNRAWFGLNALKPGGGHQHSDRLSLLSYSCGKLLALEKGVPYNDDACRRLGRCSMAHNTVVVDRQSQPDGSRLEDDQTPEVKYVFDSPLVKFAELRADHIYDQTSIYRRSVAVIEDMTVDCFDVRGGAAHDWLVHHRGSRPVFSLPMERGAFEPAEWLRNGTGNILVGAADGAWEARWKIDDVVSQLTMLGSPGTKVYSLETYPADNARVTPNHPPVQALCVRRENSKPFVAVWQAWTGDNLPRASVASVAGQSALSLQTDANRYYLKFGAGRTTFPESVSLNGDAAFCVVRMKTAARDSGRGRQTNSPVVPNGAAFIGGSWMEVKMAGQRLRLVLDRPGNLAAERKDGQVTFTASSGIHFDTWGGQNHRHAFAGNATVEGNIWSTP